MNKCVHFLASGPARFLPVIAVLMGLHASSYLRANDPQETQREPPPQLASINLAMQEFVDDGTISGAVTLVSHRGKVIHLGAVGLADIEAQQDMQTNHLFSIASMTKPVVATAVMILQDEGKLNVDDPISKFIPEFETLSVRSGEALERPITIRDAITHTSGLAGNQVFRGSLENAVRKLSEKPLAFQPGSKWQYSPGLNVAGRVVEVVSGQPLEEFVDQRIFTPLKMNSTTFFPDAKQQRRIATLYGRSDDEKLVAATNRISDSSSAAEQQGPNPSGGLFSTARDMYRFYQTILNGGSFRRQQIVSKESVEAMTSLQTGDLKTGFTPGNGWGLGWCITREPQGVTAMLSPGTYGHGGAFGTQGWVDPQTETIFVLMIQRTGLPNSDGSDVRKNFQQAAVDEIKKIQ